MDNKRFGQIVSDYYDEVIEAGYHDQKKYVSELLGIVPKHSSVLELGCGTGEIQIPLMDNGMLCEGLDESKEMISKLKAKRKDAVVHLSNIKSFNPEKKYDFVLSCHGPFSLKGEELESYILDEEELIAVLKKYSDASKRGLLINKGVEKESLRLKLKDEKTFVHREMREGDIMVMVNLLFKRSKFVDKVVLIKRRYPLKDVLKRAKTVKDYKNFKLIVF